MEKGAAEFIASVGLLFRGLPFGLFTARTETILTRKRELDAAGIEAINQKIDYLADKPGFYKVMNEGAPQEAVAKILRIVFERQHGKNIKRII